VLSTPELVGNKITYYEDNLVGCDTLQARDLTAWRHIWKMHLNLSYF